MKTYLDGLEEAAQIADKQAQDDKLAANTTTDLDSRLYYLYQQERALAIATEIRYLIINDKKNKI